MTTVIMLLWGASILAKGATAAVLLRRQVGGLIPMLLLASFGKSLILACAGKSYALWWAKLAPVDYVIGCCLTIEIAYMLAAHFPHPTRVTFFSSVIFAAISTAVMLQAGGWYAPHWDHAAAVLTLLQRNFAAACLVVLALNAAFHALPLGEWRANTRRAVWGLCGMLVLEIVGLAVIRNAMGAWWPTGMGQVVCMLAPLTACALWVGMTQAGDKYKPPRTDESIVENAAVKAIRKAAGI